METLYDVLGAHPDDDAESLKNAYRKAVKANHPDGHAGDQDAAAERFRQITTAYDILRDEKRRAAYDLLLLENQRKPLLSGERRATSHPAYQLAFIAIAGVSVGIAVAVGSYLLVDYLGITSGDGRMTAGQPRQMSAVEPARRADTVKGLAAGDGPARAPQAPVTIPVMPGAAASSVEGRGAPEATQGPSAPDAAGQTTERFAAPIDPTGPKAADGDPGRDHGAAPPGQQPRSAEPKAAAVPQDEICKRDAAQLARLRITQERDDVIRFERELGCKKLRPQVVRLRESVDPR
jgi:curved DNA-binding protein CbpA